jgi:hypothetical protein
VSETGVVIEQRLLPRGAGVQIVVKRDADGRHRAHDYPGGQANCTVGARWPDCLDVTSW